MEIKIQCDCGQKFKFDAEPVNGRMPWEVTCPVCGQSGTDKANWIIAHNAPVSISAPLSPIGSVSSAPPTGEPVAVVAEAAAPVPAEAPRPRLSLSRPAPSATPPHPPQPAVPRPVPRQFAPAAAAQEPPSSNSLFFRGVLGAFVGALLGMGIWYGIAVATGFQIGIVAWGIGALTGFGARVMAKEGNTALGVVSAFFAAVAILLGGTLAVHHMLVKELGGMSHADVTHDAYVESLKEAKDAGPLDTDQQIKAFLAKRDGGTVADVTSEEVNDFKKDELPEMQELASGTLTEPDYAKRHHHEAALASGVGSAIGWVAAFIGSIFSLWTILWLALGCISAFKLGADVGS